MAPEPPDAQNWFVLVGSTIGSIALVASVALRQYFSAGAESTPAGEITTRALGAAFVDKNAAESLTRIDLNVARLVQISEERIERDRADDLEERLAERLRRELAGKPHKPRPE